VIAHRDPTARTAPITRVKLPELADPILSDIRIRFQSNYEATFGWAKGRGLYSNDDWQRLQFAASQLPATCRTALDVGTGPGAFLNYLTLSDRFDVATGIDRVHYSKLISLTKLDLRIVDATRMTFSDDEFDAVICMEVLEHLELQDFDTVLASLRRIAKNFLLMSVPFEEPEPISSYHKQRFDEPKLRLLFPSAQITLLERKYGCPWAFMAECT
jgi:hypothetical protein